MIKRIELINFMSHAHTVIEPAAGLTVLVGPNNCGKSAVMSALQILAHNDTSTYVTRHGEKECSITVETDKGDVIQWRRKRTSTSYTVNGKTFDRLKGKVPPEVAKVLRLPTVRLEQSVDEFDIHFGNQKQPVFLINESGRAAAGFFAASSDASRLIEMQKLHKQRVKDCTRDLSRLQAEKVDLDEVAEQLDSVPEIAEKFTACEELLQSIEIHESAIKQLRNSCSSISHTADQQNQLSSQSLAMDTLQAVPDIAPTAELQSLTRQIVQLQIQTTALHKLTKIVDETPPPLTVKETALLKHSVIAIAELHQQKTLAQQQQLAFKQLATPPVLNELGELKLLIREMAPKLKENQSLRGELDTLKAKSEKLAAEIKNFAVENPTCPTCQQIVSEDALLKTIAGTDEP